MCIKIFQQNLQAIKEFVNKLRINNLDIDIQVIVVKIYASCLSINLTDNMVNEILQI